jgi:hypothetical protein
MRYARSSGATSPTKSRRNRSAGLLKELAGDGDPPGADGSAGDHRDHDVREMSRVVDDRLLRDPWLRHQSLQQS